jgi:hypothetical protein
MLRDQDVVELEQRVVGFPVPALGRRFLEIIRTGDADFGHGVVKRLVFDKDREQY